MKNLLLITVLVLSLSFAASAQTAETLPCPTFSITGGSNGFISNEPLIYTAAISKEIENYNVEYKWAVTNSEIIEGQGTLAVKVSINDAAHYKGLMVSFEIAGLPKNCPNTASESMNFEPPPPSLLIEEVSISQIDKAEMLKRPTVLDNDPTAQLYIIFKYKKNTAPKTIKRTERKLFNSLIKAEIKKERITLVKDLASIESIQFWLVPAGAQIPTIEN